MNLLAGPDHMELGWLVSAWIPHLRYLRAFDFREIVVVCKPENRYLYEDLTSKFVDFTGKGTPDMFFADRFPNRKNRMPHHIKKQYPNHKVISPNKKNCIGAPVHYWKYGQGENTFEKTFDIVIHARAETKYNQGDRNWPVERYSRLLKHLRRDGLVSACSVGTKAHVIPNTEDLTGIPLDQLCQVLAHSKMTIGPSSGVMHLAHLCACPIIVWTYDKYEKGIKGTNRKRYLETWRAFDTPVKVIDRFGWIPPVTAIEKEVRKML